MTDAIRVLGIDPGTRLCGWGVVTGVGTRLIHVDNGVIVLPAKAPLPERLAKLYDALDVLLDEHQPNQAAIETVFVNRNIRSALILGHGRGAAMTALARRGLTIHEYTPQQVKKAVTGKGRADKAQIQQMVARRLNLTDVPQVDAADAVAIALCHAQHLAFGLPTLAIPRPPRGGKRNAQAALAALVNAQRKDRQ